ncbi:hypothetical protein TGRH88_069370 [Toxoplasma gondii]|uniref:Uncharacterized protein n=1 Tax=Toxoplasma gondii TaxID=5811 RepID=A0A7J6K1S0_TOXGO|nr:hypothetical protein TGRH88_069370 [Toxoplasma gondii]
MLGCILIYSSRDVHQIPHNFLLYSSVFHDTISIDGVHRHSSSSDAALPTEFMDCHLHCFSKSDVIRERGVGGLKCRRQVYYKIRSLTPIFRNTCN